jgi:hypothetical protein
MEALLMRHPLALLATAALGAAVTAATAAAQGTGGYYPSNSRSIAPAATSGSSFERSTGRSNPALNFYGGSRSMAYAPQSRTLPLPAPLPVQTAPIAKPFSGVQQASTISPYLALDARETQTSLPAYFLYVKPQLDQQRLNQVQQAQYRRLQVQMRTATAGGAVTSPNGGIPTTGHSAQFMNNGGYYPTTTLRR